MVSSKAVPRKAVRTPTARKRRAPAVEPAVSEVVEDIVVQLVELPPQPMGAPAVEVGKAKLIRDSFTMPKNEYQTIDALKTRLLRLSHSAKKSELLRAGIAMLARLSDAQLLEAVREVPSLKTGRPKADRTGADRATKKKSATA